jgi:hypothetical protein
LVKQSIKIKKTKNRGLIKLKTKIFTRSKISLDSNLKKPKFQSQGVLFVKKIPIALYKIETQYILIHFEERKNNNK